MVSVILLELKGWKANCLPPFLIFLHYTSIFAYLACVSINSLLGGTSSPINIENILSASAAFSMVICLSVLFSGSMVVSHNCSAFISPKPLYRCVATLSSFPSPANRFNSQKPLIIVPTIFKLFSLFYHIQRRRSNINMASINQFSHMSEKEG
jgi:hypothetical protein